MQRKNTDESRRTVLKKSAVGASLVAGGLIASSGSAAADDGDDCLCDLPGVIEIGDVDVDLTDVEVLEEGDSSSDTLIRVEGRGEYAFAVFADDITVEYGDVDITVADTTISDSDEFYVEGSVDADSDVDAEQYVEFVVEGVEMIAADVLGTDVDVFLDGDQANS